MESFIELLKKERESLEKVRLESPVFFERKPQIDDESTLEGIGILGLPKDRQVGYIKLWPQDFIVEEADKNNKLHTVLIEDEPGLKDEEGNTVYADLVKVGLSTVDVKMELSKELGLEEKFIGAAGIKDKDALTSQAISFRNVGKEEIQKLSFPNFFLKNIRQGKGAVEIGGLSENRFTITVRTQDEVNEAKMGSFIENVSKNGFWNFYYIQRFGTPRFLTHIYGFHILKGDYETALKTIFLRGGLREIPLFKELRNQASERWGNWKEIEEIFSFFPLSFRNELLMLQHLKSNPRDWRGALSVLPQQVQLGVYAYTSFLFNSLLSAYIEKGEEPPKELPLFLSRNREHQALYEVFTRKHGLRLPSPAFRDFPFVQWKGHVVQTKLEAKIHGWKIMPKIFVIDFSLPKGAYATTFLSHFLTTASGMPVLENLDTKKIDSFEILAKGSLGNTIDRFADVIVSKVEENTSDDEE